MASHSEGSTKPEFILTSGERDDVIIGIFQGRVGSREIGEIDTWKNDIKGKPQTLVLIDLSQVETFMAPAHSFFTNFQKELRESGKLLGLCGLNKEVKASLLAAGIVREAEIFPNLAQAWKALHNLDPTADESPTESKKAS